MKVSLYLACNGRNAFFFSFQKSIEIILYGYVRKCVKLWLFYLIIYIRFGTKLFRQIVGIPMDTNCALLVAHLSLFRYERDFMMSLSEEKQSEVIETFSSTSRYLDDFFLILTISTWMVWSIKFILQRWCCCCGLCLCMYIPVKCFILAGRLPIFGERNCPFVFLFVVFWLWCRCFKYVLLSLWCFGWKVLGNCIDSWYCLPFYWLSGPVLNVF